MKKLCYKILINMDLAVNITELFISVMQHSQEYQNPRGNLARRD